MLKRPSKIPYSSVKTPTNNSIKQAPNINSSHPSAKTITPRGAENKPASPVSIQSRKKTPRKRSNADSSNNDFSQIEDSSIKNIEPIENGLSPTKKKKKSFTDFKDIPNNNFNANASAPREIMTSEIKVRVNRPNYSRRSSFTSKIEMLSPHNTSPRFMMQPLSSTQFRRNSKNEGMAKGNMQQVE